jgi:endo-1,4-beta-xylanase
MSKEEPEMDCTIKIQSSTRIVFAFCLAILSLAGGAAGAQSTTRIVYPQAVLGPSQGRSYEIDLRLSNRNNESVWAGTIRLLRQEDMQGMSEIRFTGSKGTDTVPPDGSLAISIAPRQSAWYRITSAEFQLGVMTIESPASNAADLAATFFYRVFDNSRQITDLVAVPPAISAGSSFSAAFTQSDTFNLGLAIVPESAVAGTRAPGSVTGVSLNLMLDNGLQAAGTTQLGGSEPLQKAFFPWQVVALPAHIDAARLMVTATEPLFCTLLGIGWPPEFRDLQIAAAPAYAESPRNMPLRALAAARGFVIGAAAMPGHYSEDGFSRTLAREFNGQTPENHMKFSLIHPAADRYDFQGADSIVAFSEANAMKVRGHTLVWHQQLPDWVTSRTWTRDQLIAVLGDHIRTVVGRYRGRVAWWDVVNEALDDSGNLRNSIWSQVIGPDYLEMAFRWAHEADPDARLFYNDYGTEGLGVKSDGAYNLVHGLLEQGVPVHGVGLQGHFNLSSPPRVADIAANISRLGALGLDVHITELDVRIQDPVSDDKLAQQAGLYREVCQACLAAPSCKALVLWGFTDKYSWVPASFAGYGSALIFDANYRPKPAYYALSDTLAGAAR